MKANFRLLILMGLAKTYFQRELFRIDRADVF